MSVPGPISAELADVIAFVAARRDCAVVVAAQRPELDEWAGALVRFADTVIGDLRAGQLGSVVESMIVPFDLFPDMRPGWGLGFLINPQPVPGGRAAGSLAWAGLANTHFWIDPASDRAGLVLTQLFPFGDQRLMQMLAGFERAVYATEAS